MKKSLFFVTLFLFFGFIIPVKAEVYEVGKLIPVDELATVHTEKFDYIDFSYLSTLDDMGNGVLTFKNIRNNNISKTAVSMNVLLFDNNKKNIGLVAYCSDKDLGEKSGFKLSGGQEVTYSVLVNSEYLVDGKKPSDVSYIAIYDDNRFCNVGNNDKYASQTIEEIMGVVARKPVKENFLSRFLQNDKLVTIIIVVVSVIIFLAIFGLILNTLYPKMYAGGTFLTFVPIANFFICVRMAFGLIVAYVYLGIMVLSVVLFFFHIPILLYIVLGFTVFAFIIDIIKIITKKYNMLYLEPNMENPLKEKKIEMNDDDQEPLDLSYTSDGLNTSSGEDDFINESDPLKDVYDDVVNSTHEDSFEDDFYSSDDE